MDKITKKEQNSHLRFWPFCGRAPLSVAAFGRVLRTLGGKNIGKCRLRAHQHPLSPPLPNLRRARRMQNLQGKTRRQRVMERVLGNVLLPASILDFRPRLGNHCKIIPVYTLFRASILDFKPKLENRCKLFPVYALFRASILDFRPELENHCRLFPRNSPTDAVILDLRGSIWESLQGNPQEWLWQYSDS